MFRTTQLLQASLCFILKCEESVVYNSEVGRLILFMPCRM